MFEHLKSFICNAYKARKQVAFYQTHATYDNNSKFHKVFTRKTVLALDFYQRPAEHTQKIFYRSISDEKMFLSNVWNTSHILERAGIAVLMNSAVHRTTIGKELVVLIHNTRPKPSL